MKIYLGADHAGFELKEVIRQFLERRGFEVVDKGAFRYDVEDDYPDVIRPVAEAVAADRDSKGIIFGGSGQGEAMVANRLPGVRAIVYYGGPQEIVKLSREHNDANILSLGARFLSEKEGKEAVRLWLGTAFKGGRHERRIGKLDGK